MVPQNFKFNDDLALRVLPQIMNETAWFIAKDVCDILGIINTTQAVEKLDEDEKLMYKLYISGQERDTWTINESGLYTLVLSSNKSEAKAFKRWLTHEVLPAIRKAGKYSTDDMNDREQQIQKLVVEIELIEGEIKVKKGEMLEKTTILKAKQSELKILLKSDIRQLKFKI